MQKNKRILIFNVNWLGDVLFSTATIRNIRFNYPESYIACIIPGRCYSVLKGNPYIDEVIIFDEKDRHRSIFSKINFIRQLRYKKFDMAVLLHGSLTRALICKLSNIPEIIGYDTKNRGIFLTKRIPPPLRDSMHRIDYYLNIAEKGGFRLEDRFLDFFTKEEDDDFARDFLKKNNCSESDFVVGINPGGNWLPKRWPKQYWALLADKMIRNLDAKVIITGSQSDLPLIKEITGWMKEKPIIAAGAMNIKQFAALCKCLGLFISADTGPLHIANSVGTKKIIALFGPTHVAITGPYPLKHAVILQKKVGCRLPCYIVDCKDNRCMKGITPEEVFDQVKTIKEQQ